MYLFRTKRLQVVVSRCFIKRLLFLAIQESTETINDVLKEKSKEQWRRSNTSLAMEITEITESFGKELAEKWSNKTFAVGSSEDNIGKQNLFSIAFLIQTFSC